MCVWQKVTQSILQKQFILKLKLNKKYSFIFLCVRIIKKVDKRRVRLDASNNNK